MFRTGLGFPPSVPLPRYDLAALKDPQRKAIIRFWEAWQEKLKRVRFLDPAWGSGVLLSEKV